MSTEDSLSNDAILPPLALIAGPTASGKSDLAVRLALALARQGRRAVVINADSAQVYADLSIISARPTVEEMQGVEHRLFGTWDGAQACSAAQWAAAAAGEVAACQAQGDIPILVGGTGLYITTLIDGIAPMPAIEPAVREAVRAMPLAEAHAALQREDPERAAVLSANDSARVRRALEVVRSTGQGMAHWHSARNGGIGGSVRLHPAILLPAREWLYPRCDLRFARMVERGAVEEVRALLGRGLDPALPVMRAIGVPELADYTRGLASLAQTQDRGAQATRNYAKRQYTWFRRQLPADWPRFEAESFGAEHIFELLLQG